MAEPLRFARRRGPWDKARARPPWPWMRRWRRRRVPRTPRLALLVLAALAVGVWHMADPHAPRIDRLSSLGGGMVVIDGDTVRHNGKAVRLVGFDTPEIGRQARCPRENALGRQATERLRTLVARARAVELETVRCACRPGTHGTHACNFGRACGTLRVDGRDVGGILVSEGLARPYVCGATSCPPRGAWC